MRINLASVLVDDQEKALRFYTDVLGFVKKNDVPMGEHRWLTVVSPEDPDGVELLLEPDEHPAVRPFKEALVADGIPFTSFAVDDVHDGVRAARRRSASGSPRSRRRWAPVTTAVLDDTCGNLIQIASHVAQAGRGTAAAAPSPGGWSTISATRRARSAGQRASRSASSTRRNAKNSRGSASRRPPGRCRPITSMPADTVSSNRESTGHLGCDDARPQVSVVEHEQVAARARLAFADEQAELDQLTHRPADRRGTDLQPGREVPGGVPVGVVGQGVRQDTRRHGRHPGLAQHEREALHNRSRSARSSSSATAAPLRRRVTVPECRILLNLHKSVKRAYVAVL